MAHRYQGIIELWHCCKKSHVCCCLFSGNALGIIGVSSGIAATLGILKHTPEVFTQMAACMGAGKLAAFNFLRQSVQNKRGDKVSVLTHTYPHKPLMNIRVTICKHQADSPLYV